MKLSEAISLLEGAWIDAGNDVGIELGIVRTLQHKLEVAEKTISRISHGLTLPQDDLQKAIRKVCDQALEEIRKDEICPNL